MGFRDDREALDARIRALENDVRRATAALDATRDTDLEVRRLRKQLATARATMLDLREHALRRRLDVARITVAGLVAALVLVSVASAASIYGLHLDAEATRAELAARGPSTEAAPTPVAPPTAPAPTTFTTPAPTLRATTIEGTEFDLAQLSGHVVVVDYGASWIEPYAREIGAVEPIVGAAAARGASIVHVFEDSSDENVERFVSRVGVTAPSIRDHDHSLAEAWGPTTWPTTFVVDRHGVVRYTHRGFRERDTPALAHEIDELLDEP